MEPVHVVHLYLAEVPFVFLVVVEAPFERLGIAVEGEAEVSYAAGGAKLRTPVERTVFEIALGESLEAAVANGVEQVVVYVVRL